MRYRTLLLVLLAAVMPAQATSPSTRQALDTLRHHARAANSDAVLVSQHGKPLLDLDPAQSDTPIELMSATKSVVALAIGLLLEDGKLASLDEPVSRIYPEWAQGRKCEITVRMLLDHTSGLQNVANAGVELEPAPDLVKLALAAELDSAPGAVFAYNNKATNLLAGIVQALAGEPMDRYLARRIFAPLGIARYTWMHDKADQPMGMAGLALSARDALKLGQLLLDDGVAPGGQRLLSHDYVVQLQQASARSPEVGLLWWRIPAWERYTLREDAAAQLRAKGVADDLRAAFLGLAGRRFGSKPEILAQAGAAVGDRWNARYGPEIVGRGIKLADLFEVERGPVAAYAANGYLGQYIVVVPDKGVVAVRQKRRVDSHLWPRDDYADFARDVVTLAQTLPSR